MAVCNRVQFHLDRETQCRAMADRASETYIRRLHIELADYHRIAAAIEISRRDPPLVSRGDGPSNRVAPASGQNPLMLLH